MQARILTGNAEVTGGTKKKSFSNPFKPCCSFDPGFSSISGRCRRHFLPAIRALPDVRIVAIRTRAEVPGISLLLDRCLILSRVRRRRVGGLGVRRLGILRSVLVVARGRGRGVMRWCGRQRGYQWNGNERCDDSRSPVKSAKMMLVAAITAVTTMTASSLGKPRGSSHKKRRR